MFISLLWKIINIHKCMRTHVHNSCQLLIWIMNMGNWMFPTHPLLHKKWRCTTAKGYVILERALCGEITAPNVQAYTWCKIVTDKSFCFPAAQFIIQVLKHGPWKQSNFQHCHITPNSELTCTTVAPLISTATFLHLPRSFLRGRYTGWWVQKELIRHRLDRQIRNYFTKYWLSKYSFREDPCSGLSSAMLAWAGWIRCTEIPTKKLACNGVATGDGMKGWNHLLFQGRGNSRCISGTGEYGTWQTGSCQRLPS